MCFWDIKRVYFSNKTMAWKSNYTQLLLSHFVPLFFLHLVRFLYTRLMSYETPLLETCAVRLGEFSTRLYFNFVHKISIIMQALCTLLLFSIFIHLYESFNSESYFKFIGLTWINFQINFNCKRHQRSDTCNLNLIIHID